MPNTILPLFSKPLLCVKQIKPSPFRDKHNNLPLPVYIPDPHPSFSIEWFSVTGSKVLSIQLSIFCLLSLSQCDFKLCTHTLIVYWISHQYHNQALMYKSCTLNDFNRMYLWLCVVMQLNYMLPQSTFCIMAVVSVPTLISLSISYMLGMFSFYYLYMFSLIKR